MTIAMSDGTTYENSLDMLFAKDMPSREETDRQQKMKDMDSTMPHDMRGPPSPEAPTENNQLSEPSYKDQNDPYSWGMGSSMDRKGPAMVPLPEPKFHEIMDHLDYLINPEKIQARPQDKESFGQMSDEEYSKWHNAPPDTLQWKHHPKPNSKGKWDEDIPGTLDIPGNMPEGWLFDRNNPDVYKLNPDEYEVRTLPKSAPYDWSDRLIHIRKKGKPPEVAEDDSIPPNARLTQAGPNKDTTPVDPRALSQGEYEQLNREGKFQSDLTPYPSHPEMQDRKHDFFNMMDNAYINKYPPQITPEEFGWYDQWQDMNKERTLGDYLELQKRHLEDSGMYQMSPKQLREKGIGPKSEDDTLPPNARQTAAETKEPSPYGETYDKFVEHLEAASKFLNPSFIPSAEEFRDAPWKEKLGFMIGTSMMMLRPTPGAKPPSMEGTPLEFWKGNAGKLDEQALEHYRKLDTPVAREEFSNMIKKKIDSASEGGETSTSNITTPEIRGMKEGSDWSEVITKPDGTKETVYDQAKIERLRNLLDNGLTFKEIGEKMDVSRNSVNSMVRRLKTMDAEEVTPSEKKANSPWSATEDKILTTWHKDPNSDLFETPALLKHRSEGAINARIKYLGLEKSAEEEASALPFVPKGAVRAPEKGSGSGGEEPKVKTILRTNKPINTPIKEPTAEPANDQPTPVRKQKVREEPEKKGGEIDNPALDAALEREWQKMVNKDKPGTFEHAEDIQTRRRGLKAVDRMPDAIKRMLTTPERKSSFQNFLKSLLDEEPPEK